MVNERAKAQIKKRYQTIAYFLSIIVIGNGIIMLIPLLMLFAFPEETQFSYGFFIPGITLIGIGTFLRKRTGFEEETRLNYTEGGVLVVLTWILSILLCLIPFMLVENLDFTHATFETVSGLTTTGLSVVDVENTSKLIIFWRSVLQFVGGAGIAIIMISAVIGPQGMGIYQAEGRSDMLTPNIIRSTKLIVKLYVAYCALGVVLFIVAGMNWFDAINHSFSAISTGGFSSRSESLAYYDSVTIEGIAILLMILGSINFAAQFLLLRGDFSGFLKIGEIRFKLLIFIFTLPLVVFFGLVGPYSSLNESTRNAIFSIVSALTTTGFTITSYTQWHQFSLFLLVMIMIIGGGYGSTSGGIKVFRVHILLNSLKWQFEKYFLPSNTIREDYIHRHDGKYYISNERLIDISNFIMVYLIFFVIMNFVYLAFGFTMIESMFEAATVLSGVGLSIGITSITTSKVILWAQIFGMILGRLEFIVIFVGFNKFYRDVKMYFQS